MLLKDEFLNKLRDEIMSRFVNDKLPTPSSASERAGFRDGALWAHELAVKSYIENRAPLSKRQQSYLDLVVCGLSNKEIGARLFVEEKSVKYMMTVLFRRFKVKSRHELAMKALGVVNENA